MRKQLIEKYAKQSVSVRDLPSSDGEKLGSLSSGQAITVTGQCEETGWYRIVFNGTIGYCSSNYLTAPEHLARMKEHEVV